MSTEPERILTFVEKKSQVSHVDHLDPQLESILVMLASIHSLMGILMQRTDNILEWIFCHVNSKKIQTFVRKISKLILKEN